MSTLAEVVSFSAKKAELRPTAGCGCCEHSTCYPHRVAAAADLLRSMPADLFGDAWVMRGDVREASSAVLLILDAITAECLPTDHAQPTTHADDEQEAAT